MRKLLCALLISTLFIGCSTEDVLKELELNSETAVLTVGELFQIEASSDYDIEYSIMDGFDYSAEVSETGLVEAKKVGVSIVNVESNGKLEPFVLAVVGQHYTYPEPSLKWEWDASTVKDSMGWTNQQFAMYGSDGFIKKNYSSKAPYAVFRFGEDDLLKNYFILVKTSYILDATNFLLERYYIQSNSDEVGMFSDSQELEDANTIIGLFYDRITYNNEDFYIIIYAPYLNNKSAVQRSAILDEFSLLKQ